MKIWLDDVRDPNDSHIQNMFCAEPGMFWAKTASVAIDRLKNGDVEYISLDHDLGPISAGTGYDVAKWIEEQAFQGTLPRLSWHCHSMNKVGKKSITAAMISAERYWEKNNGLLQV